jgi:hypothetical protein
LCFIAIGCTSKDKVIFKDTDIGPDDVGKILKVVLIQETPASLIFDVDYYLSQKFDGVATVGIYPDTPHWSVSNINALPGKHTVSISVGLNPTKPIPEHESSSLRLEISAYKDKSYKGELFKRIVPYRKLWPKRDQN